MTLEKLLGMSGDDWEKLTDAELEQWSQKFYHITRPPPERVNEHKVPIVSKARPTSKRHDVQKSIGELMKFATQMGIEIPKK